MEPHVTDITRVIQLAVAPVFLLTAIATLITGLNNRLARIVDRRRVVQEKLKHLTTLEAEEANLEIHMLLRRMRLIYFSILYAVVGALMICLVIAGAFFAALLAVNFTKMIAIFFILAMAAMVACLSMFLREVFFAVNTVAQLPQRVEKHKKSSKK
jgi:hypothetical protein